MLIQVISGQHFPKPKGSGSRGDVTDPYVTIEIFGIPADCAEERTKTVPHNGKKTLCEMLLVLHHLVSLKDFLKFWIWSLKLTFKYSVSFFCFTLLIMYEFLCISKVCNYWFFCLHRVQSNLWWEFWVPDQPPRTSLGPIRGARRWLHWGWVHRTVHHSFWL